MSVALVLVLARAVAPAPSRPLPLAATSARPRSLTRRGAHADRAHQRRGASTSWTSAPASSSNRATPLPAAQPAHNSRVLMNSALRTVT
eukprot:1145211-Rhodomonas_salina.1